MPRQETPFNLSAGNLTPVAAPTGAILKPLVAKPAIQQTAGEIASALKAFLPVLEEAEVASAKKEVTDAKLTAANMTIQEAIKFAYSSTDEQSKKLGTKSLQAHSAANAAIGAKVMSGKEFSQETINALYDPTLNETQRTYIVANERLKMMSSLESANPIIRAAANEVMDGYTRQLMSSATSVRNQRLANIAIESTYDTTHETVGASLSGLKYGGTSTEATIASIIGLDKTQRDNFGGQAGVNQAFDNAIKDSIVGFAGDNADEAHSVLEGLVVKGFYSREEATEIEDKIQSQADIRQRRLDRQDNDKYSEVQDLADTLLFQNLLEGIEPGTSVTNYLASEKGKALVTAIQAKAGDLGLDVNNGRLNSILRQTATGVFRDAGAGEYSIGEDAEKEIVELGADQGKINDYIRANKFTPEQQARVQQLADQNKKIFSEEIDLMFVTGGVEERFLSSSGSKELELAKAAGNSKKVSELIQQSIKAWASPDSAYEYVSSKSERSTLIEEIAFNGSSNLQGIIEAASGTQDLKSLGITDASIRVEAERILSERIKNITGWDSMTQEEKLITLTNESKRKLRMAETNYDDVMILSDNLPSPDAEGLNSISENTFKPSVDDRRKAKDTFLRLVEPKLSDGDSLTIFLTDLGNTNFGSSEEIADTKVVYGEALYGRVDIHPLLKESLATPLVSLGVDITGLIGQSIYDDPKLQFNIGKDGKLGVDPRRIIPVVEGTDGLDMTFLRIVGDPKEPTYEEKLDIFLTLDPTQGKESEIGQIITLFGPTGMSTDPKDPLTIRYVEYLRKANHIAGMKYNDNSKKALYGKKDPVILGPAGGYR